MTTTTETLRLLAWLSPALPTGAFAYSHGIEWAVETGDVRDVTSLRAWVEDVLRHGTGWSDAMLLRHSHAGQDVSDVARAMQPSAERLAETCVQGDAFTRAASAWPAPHPGPLPMGEGDCSLSLRERAGVRGPRTPSSEQSPYPIALGRLAGRHAIDANALCAGFLQAFAANLISAAVRLVPLGQSDGLAVLAALEPTVIEVAEASRDATLDDLGGCAWRSDIASMRHETQYTRLFRS